MFFRETFSIINMIASFPGTFFGPWNEAMHMHYITSVITDRTFVSDLDLQRWCDGLLHEAVEVLQHRGVTMLCSIVACCLTKLWKREREEGRNRRKEGGGEGE